MHRSPASVRSRFARRSLAFGSIAAGVFALSLPSPAQAHIRLLAPPSWVVEGTLGDPQKEAPCGGEDVTETGTVTTFRAGQEVTVEWQETVAHSGHFRISLARDRADLVDPVVETENGDGVSGNSISAAVMNPVAYPVLADNLFPRENVTAPQATPFSMTVKLPDEECENCTLQVIQFMAEHGPGYFYHHCANVRIVAADAELPDGDDSAGAAGAANAGAAGNSGVGTPRGTGGSANAGEAGAAGAAGAGGDGAGTPPPRSPGAAGTQGVSTDDADDGDDGGCSVARRNPARISRAIMGVLTLVGIGALWRRRRYRRRR